MSEDPTPRAEVDAACIDKLVAIGVDFPRNALPRAVLYAENEMAEMGGQVTYGSPLYLLSPEWDRDMVRLHEMGHIFVHAHLVPNQPEVGIRWDSITDEQAIALGIERFRRVRWPDVYSTIKDASDERLAKDFSDDWQAQPLAAINRLSQLIRENNTGEQEPHKSSDSLEQAIWAKVLQGLVSKLARQVYGKYSRESARDFEEALVSYLAHYATGVSTDDSTEFHYGDGSMMLSRELARRYQEPRVLARLIRSEGMLGTMAQNSDMLKAAA